MNRDTRNLRTASIARLMVFVWLFSLSIGVVNACVLQQPMTVISASHDPDAEHAGLKACQSFCDSEQNVVVKAKPVLFWDVPVLGAPIRAWPALDAPSVETAWRVVAAAPPPGPPVAIRFLRLTL